MLMSYISVGQWGHLLQFEGLLKKEALKTERYKKRNSTTELREWAKSNNFENSYFCLSVLISFCTFFGNQLQFLINKKS